VIAIAARISSLANLAISIMNVIALLRCEAPKRLLLSGAVTEHLRCLELRSAFAHPVARFTPLL